VNEIFLVFPFDIYRPVKQLQYFFLAMNHAGGILRNLEALKIGAARLSNLNPESYLRE
jgi:hypothetical protein